MRQVNFFSRNTGSKHQEGLSVIELLIILAALAIVVLISVPGSSMVLEHFRLKSASTDLLDGLSLARGEAINRSSTVRICPSSNGRFCRKDGDWSHGWLVYTDGNSDGTVQEIELIQSYNAPNENVVISATGAAKTAVSFTLAGLVPEDNSQTGSFRVCYRGSSATPKVIGIDQDGWVQTVPNNEKGCDAG